jgi:hypothetical protein
MTIDIKHGKLLSVPLSRPPGIDTRHLRFYVNIATGKSQWDPPQAPAPSADGPPPSEPPPSYNHTGPADPAAAAVIGDKKQSMASNNPYNPTNPSQSRASPSMIDDDARLAAKLQAEEDARGSSGGSRGPTPGASADYYSDPSRPQSTGAGYPPGPSSQSPMPEQKRSKGGFLSKLMGKSSGSSSRPRPQYPSYPQQQPGGYYGGYQQPSPQPGYGYPQQGYGGYPPQGGYYAQQQPPRKSGGMGTAGAAALGVGGGLLGGMLLADAIDDDHDYDNGGYDGGGGGWDDGGGGGGDFGGGDF